MMINYKPVHMSACCISSQSDTHLPLQQSKQVNLTVKACDRREARPSLTITARPLLTARTLLWYFVPSCFAAGVIVPLGPQLPPRVTFVTASLIAEQRGTVYISAKLALPFGLLPQSHYIFTFQAFSWRWHVAGKWTNRYKDLRQVQLFDRKHGFWTLLWF